MNAKEKIFYWAAVLSAVAAAFSMLARQWPEKPGANNNSGSPGAMEKEK